MLEVTTKLQATRNRTPNVAARPTLIRKWYTTEEHLEHRRSEEQIVREELIIQADLWPQNKAMNLQTPRRVMSVAGGKEV